jgi:hypothetical protein
MTMKTILIPTERGGEHEFGLADRIADWPAASTATSRASHCSPG